MKKYLISVAFFSFCSLVFSQSNRYLMWYDKPAKNWNEALPIGNGAIGAMIFGNVETELIQLNEETLWTGSPADLNPNPQAPNFLAQVRKLLFSGKNSEAAKLLRKMQGPDTQKYQPLGDLIIYNNNKDSVTNYYRDLDISKAVSTTRYTQGGVIYERSIFASAPDSVLVLRLKSGVKGKLNFSLGVRHIVGYKAEIQENDLVFTSKTKPMDKEGMNYEFRIRVTSTDGTLTKSDSLLKISNASTAVVILSAATSFNGFDKSPVTEGKDANKIALRRLNSASLLSYDLLLKKHLKDYQGYFNRLELNLSKSYVPIKPIDKRLEDYKNGIEDFHLEELYFQFGRYLLISSSRPGGIAANLQGIWCNSINPPWRSNYTTNINLQMNYWPAMSLNMAEMYQPLIKQIQNMAVNGRSTAKNYYKMNGWAAHHNSDIWAQTNPVGAGTGDPKWANWALGSPWLSQHLFEYYQYTLDKDYLREIAYPIMKGAAEFCLDWLVEKDGYLVTAPSTSPENVYYDKNRQAQSLTIASAMDMQIIWDLFTNVMEASEILAVDKDFRALILDKRSRLSPLKIGKKGNIMEWYDDFEDVEPEHRHVSHLFGLHPGRQMSPLIDRKIGEACRKTLEMRGDGGTGWSKAWKINFWARLLDGDHAYLMYQQLLKSSTLNNLFDTHPPFQIDGNFGSIAGIGEFFLQSHLGEIHLLPALPKKWNEGSVKGLKAKGAFRLDISWKKNKLDKALLFSEKGSHCTLRTNCPVKIKGAKSRVKEERYKNETHYIYIFPTKTGKTYKIVAIK